MQDSSTLRLKLSQPLLLVRGSTFETVAGQLQKETDLIVTVVNGTKLLIFESGSQLPKHLRYESKKIVTQTKCMEYYFRNTSNNLPYVFFHDEVYKWLRGGRSGSLRLSKPSWDVTHVSVTSSGPHKQPAPDISIGETNNDSSLAYCESEWTKAEVNKPQPKDKYQVQPPPNSQVNGEEEMSGYTIDVNMNREPPSGTMHDLAIYK